MFGFKRGGRGEAESPEAVLGQFNALQERIRRQEIECRNIREEIATAETTNEMQRLIQVVQPRAEKDLEALYKQREKLAGTLKQSGLEVPPPLSSDDSKARTKQYFENIRGHLTVDRIAADAVGDHDKVRQLDDGLALTDALEEKVNPKEEK